MDLHVPTVRAVEWLRGNSQPLTNTDLSRTISFARIALIVGLVFLHYHAYPNSTMSPFDGMDPARHQAATFINSFVLFFFFSVVPLLSMVSGWLYFTFAPADAATALRSRIKRRIGSLYLPLVFWNALFVVLALALFRATPGHEVLNQINFDVHSAGWHDYVNAIFAVKRHPVAFQFWFVRDLLVTILISPLLWLLLRQARLLGAAVLGAAWLVGHDLGIFFRADVVFFFYLGALLRLGQARLHIGGRAAAVLLTGYVALVALRALAPTFVDVAPERPEWLDAATRAMRLIGVVACWGACLKLARTRIGAFAAQYSGLSFFLFATHFPLIAAVKHFLWLRLPAHSNAWMVAHYGLSVVGTIAIALAARVILAKAAPGWFALMNGGRLVPVSVGSQQSAAARSPST
jgi:succinoglycan biosynthesis protein ExoH